jgi:hypothetical protein
MVDKIANKIELFGLDKAGIFEIMIGEISINKN